MRKRGGGLTSPDLARGLSRLRRKFKHTIPDTVRKLTRDAMKKGAVEIVAQMKAFAPVDGGALRDSIGWTWGDAPKGALTLARSRSVRGDVITIYAGTRDKGLGDMDAFYARWIEFGTQKMMPRPFFYVSYRLLRRRVKSRVTRAVTKGVKQAAGTNG